MFLLLTATSYLRTKSSFPSPHTEYSEAGWKHALLPANSMVSYEKGPIDFAFLQFGPLFPHSSAGANNALTEHWR